MSEQESLDVLFDEFSSVSIEEWRQTVREELDTSSLDDLLEWASIEGVTMPAYLHREALDDVSHVGAGAEGPVLASSGDGAPNDWEVCQIIDHPDPQTAHEHAVAAVDGGADALKLVLASGETTDSGIDLRTPDDLDRVLDGIDLTTTALHLDRGLGALVLCGGLLNLAEQRDLDPTSLRGSVAYDPVAVLATGQLERIDRAFSLEEDLRAEPGTPSQFRTTTIDARVYHDAGASAVQELAFVLGALCERLARASEREVALSSVVEDLSVLVSVSTSYFVEIAKLRALRLLVPQVVAPYLSDSSTASSFSPTDLHVHAETSRRTETRYDPHSNMLRASTEALAATAGGCDTLSVRPYDASLRPPDPFGHRIARNTHHVLRHEAHADRVADPAAGAYYIETLTDTLAKRAWSRFQAMEDAGGILAELQDGSVQQEIEKTRRKRLSALDEREQILVGTTHYPVLGETQRENLSSAANEAHTTNEVASSLDLSSMTSLRTALREGTSFPDIRSVLQSDSPAFEPLPQVRLAEEFESIRLDTERYAETHDGPPTVLLVPMGPPSPRSARATFARNFLGVAGFEIEEPIKFETVDAAADTAVEMNATAVVLCSSNAEYATLAPALASALTERDATALLGIAGSPTDCAPSDAADFFVHQDSSLQKTLTTLQERLGIPVKSDA